MSAAREEPKVKQCPTSGTGVHNWLFHAACQLVEEGWSDEEAAPWMRERMTRAPGPDTEIEDALASARREDREDSRKWPARNLPLIQKVFSEAPWVPETPNAATEPTLRLLFPGDPLLCIGKDSSSFTTGILSGFKFLNAYSFIVPSPMTAKFGKTKKGHMSQHALENTGPRHYMIVEFDWGVLENQLKLLRHLSWNCAPGHLCMVVHSGSKSAHGWFDFRGVDEEKVLRFFNYAVSLGADNRLWLRSQFCRMPGGTRDDGRPQSIMWLDPLYLTERAKSFVSNSP